jgi:hypothetical protein
MFSKNRTISLGTRKVVRITYNERKYSNWWYDKTTRSWASLILVVILTFAVILITRLTTQDFVNANCPSNKSVCETAQQALLVVNNGYATLGLVFATIVSMTGLISSVVTIVGFNDTAPQQSNSGIFSINDYEEYPDLYKFIRGFADRMQDTELVDKSYKNYPTHEDYFDWSKIYLETNFTIVFSALLDGLRYIDPKRSALITPIIHEATCNYMVSKYYLYQNCDVVLVYYKILANFHVSLDQSVYMRLAILETSEILKVKEITSIINIELPNVSVVEYRKNFNNIVDIWERISCLNYEPKSVTLIKSDFIKKNPDADVVTFAQFTELFRSYFGLKP